MYSSNERLPEIEPSKLAAIIESAEGRSPGLLLAGSCRQIESACGKLLKRLAAARPDYERSRQLAQRLAKDVRRLETTLSVVEAAGQEGEVVRCYIDWYLSDALGRFDVPFPDQDADPIGLATVQEFNGHLGDAADDFLERIARGRGRKRDKDVEAAIWELYELYRAGGGTNLAVFINFAESLKKAMLDLDLPATLRNDLRMCWPDYVRAFLRNSAVAARKRDPFADW